MKLLDKLLIGMVMGGYKKKSSRDQLSLGFERKKAITHNIVNCGNFTESSGVLESEHPYLPLTACRWNIEAEKGVKLLIRIVKMDIEEEDPTDSPTCNERDGDHLPSCIGSGQLPKSCEWDYLRIQTGSEQSEKMCKYVEKDPLYAMQPDGKDYDYYFDEYTYDTAYDVGHWYQGQRIESNSFSVEFATDDSASFYGFKLEWEAWDVDPCKQDTDKCGQNGECIHQGFNQYTCLCNSGYELDDSGEPFCTKLNERIFNGPNTKDLMIIDETNEMVASADSFTSKNKSDSKGTGNWYIALEKKFQEKLRIFLDPSSVESNNTKRPRLVSHLYERIKNAINKSFFGIVRRCDVSTKSQTSGKKFRGTLFQLKRATGLRDLDRLFNVFLEEKYDQPRCKARQRKLSNKTSRFLKWAMKQTTAPQ